MKGHINDFLWPLFSRDITPWVFWKQNSKNFVHVFKAKEENRTKVSIITIKQILEQSKRKYIRSFQLSLKAYISSSTIFKLCWPASSAVVVASRCSSSSLTIICWASWALASSTTIYRTTTSYWSCICRWFNSA